MATNGFELTRIYDDVPDDEDVRFKKSETQKRFEEFIKFVRGKDIDELEIAASLHYLRQEPKSDEEIKDRVTKKRASFKREQIDKIWEQMTECQLI